MDFIYSIKYINCPILLSLTLLPLYFENLHLNGNLKTNKAINKVRDCSNTIKTVRISEPKVQLACLSNTFIVAVTNFNQGAIK